MNHDKKVEQKMHDEWQKWCRRKCGQENNKEYYIPTHNNPLWEIWRDSWMTSFYRYGADSPYRYGKTGK